MLKYVNFNNNNLFQITLPIIQPLRLWNSSNKREPMKTQKEKSNLKKVREYKKAFSLKIGFIEKSNGEKQMVVAGKIFKIPKD